MTLTLPRLPNGWIWTSVVEVGSSSEQAVLTGPFGTTIGPGDFVSASGEAVPVVTIGCLRDTGIDLTKAAFVSRRKAAELARYRLRPGDILFSRMATVGRAGFVENVHEGTLFNYHLMRLRLREDALDPHFFIWYVRSSEVVRAYVRSVNHGMTRDGINTEQLLSMPVPLAPRPLQQRIVDGIDSLFSRLDAAVAGFKRAQAKLKAYRAAVLKAAVDGRLVPTEAELARKEGRAYEPADVLLARILKERRRRWEEAELVKMKGAGKTPEDDKWKARYKDPLPEIGGLPQLPDGWCWTTAAALFWDAGYGTSEKCTSDGAGRPVLRIPNIVRGGIDLDDLKFASGNADLSPDGEVTGGDFLFIRTNGSRSLIGRGALVLRRYIPALHFASYLIRLRLVEVDDAASWFALAWHGPTVRAQLLKVAASSAGQHNVSLTAASSFAIPLPPSAEQSRILAELDRLESAAAAVDEQIAKDVQRSKRLKHAILKWAFEGRLVDQDPADEPAEQLLARVRAERAAAVPIRKTRARKLKAAS
jgi:type I restriction enzyme S subunit